MRQTPGEAWQTGYRHLLEYVKHTGTASVASKYVSPAGFKLGVWVMNRRGREQALTPAQRRLLEELPGWRWLQSRDERWEEAYRHLADYLRQNGGSCSELSFVASDGFRLGAWVARQRYLYAAGRMKGARRRRLEALRGWVWSAPPRGRWPLFYVALTRFAEEHGQACPRWSFVSEGDLALGRWVCHQRLLGRQGRLAPERRVALESLPGWTWGGNRARWEAWLHRLRKFAEKHGHARVPYRYVTADGHKLGSWVAMQRHGHHRLSPERQRLLEEVPGWVWKIRR